jgi:hypothetical protein
VFCLARLAVSSLRTCEWDLSGHRNTATIMAGAAWGYAVIIAGVKPGLA